MKILIPFVVSFFLLFYLLSSNLINAKNGALYLFIGVLSVVIQYLIFYKTEGRWPRKGQPMVIKYVGNILSVIFWPVDLAVVLYRRVI